MHSLWLFVALCCSLWLEGGAISMHGPQNSESAKAQYRVGVDGTFFSGEINMALALTRIGTVHRLHCTLNSTSRVKHEKSLCDRVMGQLW